MHQASPCNALRATYLQWPDDLTSVHGDPCQMRRLVAPKTLLETCTWTLSHRPEMPAGTASARSRADRCRSDGARFPTS